MACGKAWRPEVLYHVGHMIVQEPLPHDKPHVFKGQKSVPRKLSSPALSGDGFRKSVLSISIDF